MNEEDEFFPTPSEFAPRRGRPPKPKEEPFAHIDMETVAKARGAAEAVCAATLRAETLNTLAVALAAAWGGYCSSVILFKQHSKTSKGRPNTAHADGLLIRDCARALESAGHPHHGVWGDGDGVAGRAMAVQLADALKYAITGKRPKTSGRGIKAAQMWRRKNDKNIG